MTSLADIFSFNPNSPLLFTQFYFWAFFAIVYAGFALIVGFGKQNSSVKRVMRSTYLLFISWFFYYKTSGLFLLILLFITLSDYLIAHAIAWAHRRNCPHRAKVWLATSVIIDLSILCYFKYAYFFTDIINTTFATEFEVFDIFAYIGNGFSMDGRFLVDRIILPVGISFYIFQVISYTTDVYRKAVKPLRNPLDFGFYVAFFPQLVAGPIVRASEFIPQIFKPFFLTKRQFGIAVFWILNGLIKKIVLSDYLAVNFIDRVFENPLLFTGFENLMALFAYSLQVYADFSGYTDIAIGVAMLMGFYLPKNFDSPYKSQNPQEFWRRWHMSLSRWLKNYLYIPLGGNRSLLFGTKLIATKHRKLACGNINSFITMLLGGLWHGASWNFVIWGALNGVGMIVYKFWAEMAWHWRMLFVTLVTATLGAIHYYFPIPIWNMLFVWMAIIFVITFIRYIYHLISKTNTSQPNILRKGISTAWAVIQTFVFITFTRLFFRAASNLDPATANQQAWKTAQNMVQQIGSAWDINLIPIILIEYIDIFIIFMIGMLIHWLPAKFKQYYRLCFAALPTPIMALMCVIVVIIVYQFITADLQAFIYFQF